MSAKKIVVIVLSSTLALILGFCTFWVVNNYDAIEYAMSGSALYTKTDLEKAYEDGYNSAGFDVKDLNDQIKDLRNKLETKTAEYNKAKANYEEYLKKFNDLATLSEKEKAELNTTISALNNEIVELEKDIVNLETTLETYKEFQAQLEAENKVIATFEYDGAVILLQNYEKGAKLQDVIVPENTGEITFNGWTVNGQAVDISNYTINESTTFVADLTYHYTVNFTVDETLYNSQTTSNGVITLPENPTKSGYTFIGWSVDGETIIDVQLSDITSSINYVAVFDLLEKYNALELINDNDVIESVSDIWSDGENTYYSNGKSHYVLDKETYSWRKKHWEDTTITQLEVLSFKGRNVWASGKNIYLNDSSHQCVLNKETLTWEEISWNIESDFQGSLVWTDGENCYCANMGDHYQLDLENYTWEKIELNFVSLFSPSNVWSDGKNTYYSEYSEHYVLDKETSTWAEKTWDELPFVMTGSDFWTDGEYIYFSRGDEQYVLDKETSTWAEKTWDGLESFSGSNVWTDGENYYLTQNNQTYKFVLK